VYDVTGPDSGAITADGYSIGFAGLEPVTVSGIDDLVVNVDSSPADLTLRVDDGVLEIGGDSMETIATDCGAVSSVTINFGNDADRLTIGNTAGFDLDKLTINGGGGNDTIVIARNVDMTLTDTALTVGGDVITLDSIEIADLAGGGVDNVFAISGWTGSADIDGGDGAGDQVVMARNANMSLSDTALIVGGQTIGLTGIEAADLAGGASNNTLDASAFTRGLVTLEGGGGNDSLIGGAGDDIYIFGNGWGTDTVTDAAGSALMDFGGFAGSLTLSSTGSPTVSGTITSGAGDTVDYAGGATFNTDIGVLDTQAAEDALAQGLDALADLGDHLDEFDRLGEELFVLSGRSIGDYLDIGTILRDQLARPVADFLASDADPTLDELIGVIDGSSGNSGNLTFTVEAVGARAADGDLTLDLSLNATRTLSGIELNLGEDIGNLLTVDDLTGELTTAFDWDFSVDVDGATFHVDFASDMTVTADIDEDVEFDAEAGFLELHFGAVDGDISNITLDADVTVDTSTLGSGVAEADLRDPDFSGFVSSADDDADVSIDLYGEALDITGVTDTTAAEIHFGDDLFWTIRGMVTAAENAETETTVTIDAEPVLADDAVVGRLIRIVRDGEGENDAEADGQVRLILSNADNVLTVDGQWDYIPDGEAYELINNFSDNFDELGIDDFYLTNAGTVSAQLAQFRGFLGLLETKTLGYPVPLTQETTLDDLVDLDVLLQQEVLDLLQLVANTEDTVLRDLNDGAGVETLDGNDIHMTLRDGSSFEVDLTFDATDSTASGFAMATVGGADINVTLRDDTSFGVDFDDMASEELAVWNLGDIGTVDGNDIRITLNNGTSFTVDLNSASNKADFAETETVQDLMDRILAAAPGTLVDDGDFQVTTESNRLRLVDRTTVGGGGGVGFRIANFAGSTAATSLGIAGIGTGVPGSLTITGNTLPAATLLDLMNRIRAAADDAGVDGGAFEVTYDRDRGVLRLVDNTNWQGALSVANASGSNAATRLGIADPASIEGTAHVIESPLVTIGDLLDRIEAAAPGGLLVDRAEMRLVDFTSGDELFEVTAVEHEVDGEMVDSAAASDLGLDCSAVPRDVDDDGDMEYVIDVAPNPGPNFATVQEMADAATQGSTSISGLAFDPETHELSFLLEVTGVALADVTDAAALFDVGALTDLVVTDGDVTIAPTAILTLPITIELTEIGFEVTEDTSLSVLNHRRGVTTVEGGSDIIVQLNDGTSVEVDLTVGADDLPATDLGLSTVAGDDIEITLSDDRTFSVDLNSDSGTATFAPDETLQDLVDRITDAATDSLEDPDDSNWRLVDHFEIFFDPDKGVLVSIDHTAGTGGFTVANVNGSTASTDLGLDGAAVAEGEALVLAGESFVTLGDLMERIRDAAVAAGVSVGDAPSDFEVIISADGMGVQLVDRTAGGSAIAGSVTEEETEAALEDAAADFGPEDSLIGRVIEITSGAEEGQTRTIVGNTATTLTLESAWDTGLSVDDTYEIPTIFTVAALNKSGAQLSLGLVGPGVECEECDGELVLGVGVLHGDTASAHFSLEGADIQIDADLSAIGVDATGMWGPVAVTVSDASINSGSNIAVDVTLNDATLREMNEGLSDPQSLFSLAIEGSLYLTLPIDLTTPIAGAGDGPANLHVEVTDFNDADSFDYWFTNSTALGDFLEGVKNLTIEDFIGYLDSAADYLVAVETETLIGGADNPIVANLPGFDENVGQMLAFGSALKDLVIELIDDPPASVQDVAAELDALSSDLAVTLRFVDTGGEAALRAELDLTVPETTADLPLFLLLSDPEVLVADTSGEDPVTVHAEATIDLDLGVDLTDSDALQPFLADSTALVFDVWAHDNAIEFTALYGPAEAQFGVGSLDYDEDGAGAGTGPAIFTAGFSGNQSFADAEGATGVSVAGDLDVVMPIDFPEGIDDNQLNLHNDQVTWGADGNGSAPDVAGLSLLENLDSFRLGFDQLFVELEQAFDEAVFGYGLPLVGSQLADAVNLFDEMRVELADALAPITAALASDEHLTPDLARQALYGALGPCGLDWLQDGADSGSIVTPGDIELAASESEVTFTLDVLMPQQVLEVPVALDLNLPGLGLEIGAPVLVEFGFNGPVTLSVGLDAVGAFVDTSAFAEATFDLNVAMPAAAAAELTGYAALTFTPHSYDSETGVYTPDTIARDEGNWILDGFRVGQTIRVVGSEHKDGVNRIAAINADGTILSLEYGVGGSAETAPAGSVAVEAAFEGKMGFLPYGIFDPAATLDGRYRVSLDEPGDDDRLSVTELVNNSADQMVLGTFAGAADVDMHLNTNLPRGAAFPPYQMDVGIDWSFAHTDPAIGDSTPTIAFDEVQFDLIGFMRDFVGSALERLNTAFEPLDGIVNFLNSAAWPILSFMFGRTSYLNASGSFGGETEIGDFAGAATAVRALVEGGKPFERDRLTEFAADIIFWDLDLFDNIRLPCLSSLTGEYWIDIGSFTVDGDVARGVAEGRLIATSNARAFGSMEEAIEVTDTSYSWADAVYTIHYTVHTETILGEIVWLALDGTGSAKDAANAFVVTQNLPGRKPFEGWLGGAVMGMIPTGIDPIELPILDNADRNAGNSFELLMGNTRFDGGSAEDNLLLKYDTPELFVFLYQDFPLDVKKFLSQVPVLSIFVSDVDPWVPTPYLFLSFEARADFAMAFDTTGLETYRVTENPDDIAEGIYFDDTQGVEPNPAVLGNEALGLGALNLVRDETQARILGGLGLGQFVKFSSKPWIDFKLGTEVGMYVGADYNFEDPDGDYKIRASEFDRLHDAGARTYDVPDFFQWMFPPADENLNVYEIGARAEVRWDIYAKLKLFFVTIFDIRFNLITLGGTIDFPRLPVDAPDLATQSGSTLYLNIGDETGGRDSNRWYGSSNSEYNQYKGRHEQLYIGADPARDKLIVSGWGHTESFFLSDIDKIVGYAGSGDDVIIVSDDVPVELEIYGGSGGDILIAGGGIFTLDGGDGGDYLRGGNVGGTLRGGAGRDLIDGGLGSDTIEGGDDDDYLFGWLGDDEIYGDGGDDYIRGGLGADTIHGGDGKDKIFGERNDDLIYGDAGNDVIDGGPGDDTVYGGPDNDLIFSKAGSDYLDGEGDSDTFLVYYQGGDADTLITVLDTGDVSDTDVFVAIGTMADDQFLLRANADGSLAFVAMINGDCNVERVNYTGVERITVNGGFGDDDFAVDDTAAEITLNGEFGDDTFQIGQLFRSQRTEEHAKVSVDDEFATIETTRGFLSNGISAPMTVNGGFGDDNFVVFHNKAVLTLNGDAGDDVFELRAFALAGSQEPQRERTDISGGAGADLVQYAVNAPVNIDGGDGLDTLTVIGTEFGDDFVVTRDGVYGAGLTVNFVNIESLRVDGAEGNDRFFVQSTSEAFATELFGGLGSDTFNMSGDMPPIVSNDLRGHSGLLLHSVESADPRFDGQTLYGISANVADNDEPFAVIRQSDGSTIITEGDTIGDSYQIVLTREPDTDVYIKVLAPIPSPDNREKRALSFRVDSTSESAETTPDGTSLTLEFTPDNWYLPQTVNVSADNATMEDIAGLFTRPELGDDASFGFDDDAYEGVHYGIINHLVLTEEIRIRSNPTGVGSDYLIDSEQFFTDEYVGRKVEIVSGAGAGQSRYIVDLSGEYHLVLDRPWDDGETPTTQSEYLIRFDDAIVGVVTGFDNTDFTLTDAGTAFGDLTGAIVEIVAGPGAGQQRLILSSSGDTLTLNGVWNTEPEAGRSIYRIERYDGLAIPSVRVQVNDNDEAGLIVDETQGYENGVTGDGDTITAVIEGGDGDQLGEQDVVQVRLSRQPTANVSVNLSYDGEQLDLTTLGGTKITELQFNSANWNVSQSVVVKGLADGVREGFHASLIEFEITSTDQDAATAVTDSFETVPESDPIFYVGLSQQPAGLVAVTLNGVDLTEGTDFEVFSSKVVFVEGGKPAPVSGKIEATYDYTAPGFDGAYTKPVLTHIADADAPTVLVRQTGGSTDVIEDTSDLSAFADDAYELVLTGQPTNTVTVTVTPDITKTTRTGGIRHDEVQVSISSEDNRVTDNGDGTLTVTFSTSNWDSPVVIDVAAIDDDFVDGGDTKEFAPGPNTLSGILGPVFVDGAGGEGSLSIGAPVMLPGETNVKESTGYVVEVSGTSVTVSTADLPTGDLIDKTIEITAVDPDNPHHSVIGQFRLITATTDNDDGTTSLTINEAFSFADGESENDIKSYAITEQSLNFFVDETIQVDVMFVHDEDSPADSEGWLTSTRLWGLNMGPDLEIGGQMRPGGITYGNLEVLDIDLGTGNNDFHVLGTHTREDGYQTWTFLNTGDDIEFSGVRGDVVTVTLNAEEEIGAGGTVNSSTAASWNAFATLVDNDADFGSLAGKLVGILDDGIVTQTRRILYNSTNTLEVAGDWDGSVEGLAYRIVDEADGPFAVNTQGGDDHVDASASSLGIVIFGGLDDDTLTGGSGGDIIFGDRGRVDFFGEDDGNSNRPIVTRLGTAPDPITGTVTGDYGDDGNLLDANATFPVDDGFDIGLKGLFVDINDGTGFRQEPRLITSNTATTLSISPDFSETLDSTSAYRVSTYPEDQTDGVIREASLIITVDDALGGNDTIDAGAGADQVFGGAGNDDVAGQQGDDIILGDSGVIDRLRDPAAPSPAVFTPGESVPVVGSLLDLIRTKFPTGGGSDNIAGGDGNDTILAGYGIDFVNFDRNGNPLVGEAGDDLIVGDNGFADFDLSTGQAVLTRIETNEPNSGDDDFITAGAGEKIIFGGAGGDKLLAGGDDQPDIVVGDEGVAIFDGTTGIVTRVATKTPTVGGADEITAGNAENILFGGSAGDAITGGSARDIILGDNGVANFDAQGLLTDIATTDPDLGGGDDIISGDGPDIVLGGFDSDFVNIDRTTWAKVGTDSGNDLILGDNGQAIFDTSGGTSSLTRFETTQPTIGGDDQIFADGGIDIVFGGTGADRVLGGDGPDILLGDHGLFDVTRPPNELVVSTFTSNTDGGGSDRIEGEGGHDQILGQQSGDMLFGGPGEDDIIGGHNVIFGDDGADEIHGDGEGDFIFGDNGIVRRFGTVFVGVLACEWQRYGGSMPDIIREFERFDIIEMAGGNDTIYGDAGRDTIYGQHGNDTIDGGAGDDEISGDQGDDTINGGADADFVTGDIAYFVRAVDGAGEPVLNANETWHRDIYLELPTVLLDVIDIDTTPLRSFDPNLAKKLVESDLIILTGDFNSDGSKDQNVDNGAWDTNILLLDMELQGADIISGNGGDDTIIGMLGADTLHGNDDADLIYGDLGDNSLPFTPDFPLLQTGLRITAIDSGATDANFDIGPLGTSFVTRHTMVPNDLRSLDPRLALPTRHTSDIFINNPNITDFVGMLRQSNGDRTVPYATIVSDAVHHVDVLPGNDWIVGGSGNDFIAGDSMTTQVPLTVDINGQDSGSIDVAAAQVVGGLSAISRELGYLSMNHNIVDHAIGGAPAQHDIEIARDVIAGSAGDDIIIGDHAVQYVPLTFDTSYVDAVPMNGTDPLDTPAELLDFFRDMEHVVVDFGHVVFEAHDAVLDALVADANATSNPTGVTPATVIDPEIHNLMIGNDQIIGGGNDDILIGDEGAIVLAAVDEYRMATITQSLLGVDAANLAAVSLQLRSQDEQRRFGLATHVAIHHDNFLSRFPDESELLKIPYDFGLQKSLRNDSLNGEGGYDLMFGDIGVLSVSTFAQDPDVEPGQQTAQSRLDVLLEDVSQFILDDQHFNGRIRKESHISLRNYDTQDWRDSNDLEVSRTSNNDQLAGGADKDVVYGDHALVGVAVSEDAPTQPLPLSVAVLNFKSLSADIGELQDDFKHLNKDLVSWNDLVNGDGGNDVLLGLSGDDTVFGDEGDDELFGGEGVDILDGGTGNNLLFPYANDDPTADPGALTNCMSFESFVPHLFDPGIDADTPTANGLGMYNDGFFYLDTTGNGAWDKVSGGDTFRDFGINPIRDVARPVVGDWDGDGTDDVGIYHTGLFYLDTTGNGVWDKVSGGDTCRDFGVNAIRNTATPIVGDWDGDGVDDLGLYNAGFFYLDTTENGVWDKVSGGDTFRDFGINPIRASAQPLIGDWDGDGDDDLGIHNSGLFYLDTTGNGVWDKVSGGDTCHDFGINPIRNTGLPLAGRWAAPAPLLAAGGPHTPDAAVIGLTERHVAPILDQAIALWAMSGLDQGEVQRLQSVDVWIADLPGARLGEVLGTTITLDIDAAGYGWFVDATPTDDDEFDGPSRLGLVANSSGPAESKMDLLTVVLHELGHVLGYEDLIDEFATDDVMNSDLPIGARRDLSVSAVDAVFSEES